METNKKPTFRIVIMDLRDKKTKYKTITVYNHKGTSLKDFADKIKKKV